ncbi:phospholipase A2 family protein [Methylobacterium sp. NPDC080182]|uniref:phospholipase A2 family protein n=1 Tax=Methylobacterium sp. NPDC080182 TaxID=3390590 RepID=UPI003CFCD5CF
MRPSLLATLGLLLVAYPHASGAQGVPDPRGVQSVQSVQDVQDVRDLPAATVEPGEPRPGPPPPLPDISDPNGRAGEALNEPGERSGIPKALRSSGSKAGGPANDLNPSGQAEAPAPPKGDLGRVIAGKELFHGNYCGTGQRGEGLPPTDALDAACMRHDACYDAAGYRSCACDATLRREASTVSDSPDAALEVRRRALSVIEATAAMACRAP